MLTQTTLLLVLAGINNLNKLYRPSAQRLFGIFYPFLKFRGARNAGEIPRRNSLALYCIIILSDGPS